MTLDRAAILGAQDGTREKVSVPEWGGDVWVQAMSGLDLDRYEARQLARRAVKDKGAQMDNMRAELVALTACTEAGERLFTLEDVEALSKKSGRALNHVCKVAMRLNGLSGDDLEQLAKN